MEAYEWFKTKYPDRYRKLKKLSQQMLPKPDLVKVKAEYEKLIEQYENDAGGTQGIPPPEAGKNYGP